MSEATLQAVQPEKTYTLRALEAKDVFIVSKILSQIGLKEFKEAFDTKLLSGGATDEKGLSSLSGMDKKEIESLPMVTFAEMVIDVFRKQEFMDFFKLVSTLFK